MGKTKTFTYDAYGRLNTVVERNGGVDYTTRYTYDHFGNLLKITDANGDVRNFTYDALGRRTAAEDVHPVADATFLKILYAYDKNGNLTVEHRSDKTSLGYTYDFLNRPLTMAQNSSTVYTLAYDSCTVGVGRLCSESSGSYSKTFAYDPNGNAKAIDFIYGSTTYSELFAHDRAGRVTSSTLADGMSLAYGYQGWQFRTLNAKEAAATSSKVIITDIKYDADQLPFITWFGNGAKTYAQRDPEKLYRLNGLRTSFTVSGPPDGPFFQELEFYYDANNRVVEMRELDATSTKRRVQYSYDDLDRLTSAHATTTGNTLLYKEFYSYDPVGNFLSTNSIDPTGTSTTSTYSYSKFANANSHAVTTVTTTANGVTAGYMSIGYDMRGNVTSTRMFNASGTEILASRHTNVYNAANDMTAMGLGTATQTQLYLYDKGGIRFTQKAATSTLVYASPQFNATINASGTRTDTEKHASYGAQLLATIDGTGLAARILYQHPDHLTGANAITNEARGFEEVLDYMPFGAVRVDAKLGSWSEQRKYAGHDFDDSSGYSYMKARYYEPGVKRFLGEDAAFWSVSYDLSDPQLANSYSYARGNPVGNDDPDGKAPKSVGPGYFTATPELKQLGFAFRHPAIAIQIGWYDRNAKNVSTIAGNFAINSGLSIGNPANDFNSERNAYRHTVWQSIVAQKFGLGIARQAGNSHEADPYTDLSVRSFSGKDAAKRADQTADLLNNQIGRLIGITNPGASNQELALKALDYYHHIGLYSTRERNGGVEIEQTRITKETYNSSRTSILKTRNDGLVNQ